MKRSITALIAATLVAATLTATTASPTPTRTAAGQADPHRQGV